MTAKRYLAFAAGSTGAGLIVIAVINLLVDPFAAYPAVHLKRFDHFRDTVATRVASAEMSRRGNWDMAILGSSRPQTGLPSQHRAFVTNRVCNLSVTGPRMTEVAAIFDHARAHNPLRRVLLCLDFTISRRAGDEPNDFAESRFNPDVSLFQYHCKNLIGSNARDLSWTFVRRQLKHDLPPEGERDGFHVRTLPPNMEQRALVERVLRSLAHTYASSELPSEEMDQLRRVVAACRKESIELTVAINPVHPLDLELLRAADAWDRLEEWKRAVAKIVAEESPDGGVTLWDFAGYWNPMIEEVPPAGDSKSRMKLYFESSHYTPVLGEQLLDRIYCDATNDLGSKFTAANIEAHLDLIRTQREAYVSAHRSDVEWAHNVGKQVLAGRKRNVIQSAAVK